MIVAQRKSIPDLLEIVKNHKKLLVLGCGTCVTVCLAGGQREVSIIASALRMAAKLKDIAIEVEELTIERQCDNVFIEQAAEAIERNDAVAVLGMQIRKPDTRFGQPLVAGVSQEGRRLMANKGESQWTLLKISIQYEVGFPDNRIGVFDELTEPFFSAGLLILRNALSYSILWIPTVLHERTSSFQGAPS